MDSKVNNILDWKPTQISYQCFFGELKVFSKKLEALKSAPNIFEVPMQDPKPAIDTTNTKVVSHAYSLPCNDDLKPGVSIQNGYIHHILSVYRHFYVSTRDEFETYLTRFKGKTLNSLKRKLKKVDKSNTQTESCISFSKAEEMQEFLRIAKSISQKSYQEKLLGRALPTSDDFINHITQLAEQDKIRGYILYAEDTPIAYNLCPIYGQGIMLYDYTGYDPEYSRYSAGTVLQYRIIEQCFADPSIQTYDLCTGEGKHKEFFANGSITCCDAFYFPLNMRYLCLVYSRLVIEKSARSLVSIIDKAGLKDRIKTFIRRLG